MSAGLVLLSVATASIGLSCAIVTGQSLLIMALSYILSGSALLLIMAYCRTRRFDPRGGGERDPRLAHHGQG